MQWGILGLLLAAILAFFVPAVQKGMSALLHRHPPLLWAAAALLVAFFCAVAAWAGQGSFALAGLVTAYVFVPAAVAYAMGAGPVERPRWGFLIILLLWLPIEFAAGGRLVSKHAQGFLHSVACAIASGCPATTGRGGTARALAA